MKQKIIKGLLMSSSVGLTACTVNSSDYNVRMNEWTTDSTSNEVVLQSRVIPKYDNHFIWLGMREIDYLKQIDYRAINKNSDHMCIQLDVHSAADPRDTKNSWNETVNSEMLVLAPHQIKDLGFYRLPRGKSHEITSHFSAFSAYQDGDEYVCSDPNDTGCYITTAMCRDTGKADDCAELQSLRKYRDEVMRLDEEGRQLIKEYYLTAPKIVSLIDQEPDHREIYQALRERYIAPAAHAADVGDNHAARELYKTMVELLAQKYEGRI